MSREVRWNPKETTVTYTTDLVTRAIRSCSNTKAFGPDKLSIFHLKHLGPRATAYLTALFNDSVNSSRIPAIWKSSIVIPIPKPGKDSSQSTSYRPFSFICSAAKVLEALILPTVNAHLLPADDQHGFRPGHSTTSALLQLTTDIATGFNQKKPSHWTVCVAVDLTAVFGTVSHNVLISKISRSTLPEVTCRWLSCYLRGRQAVTSCRGVKSSAGVVHAGVPQGSKLSPSLFSFYLADMPKPTYPVKWICYADDISVWASGAKIPELEVKINDYLEKMSEFLKLNSLLISAPKSTVPLFTPETKQAKYHPDIKIAGSQLPLNRSPKILGVHLDTCLTFNVHCSQAATRVSNRNNVLKALAGTTWGQQKETILITYKAIGRSVANYGAPVWSTNASVTSIGKIQIAQNEALRIATGSHKMSNIDHFHNETEMLTVKQHSDLLSAPYLIQCLDPDRVCHNITTMDVPPLLAATKKETLQAVHTEAVTRAINSQQPNRVLHNRPPPISLEEDTLRRPQRTTLSQLRSGHCRLLNSYQNRLKPTVDPRCPDCGVNPHDVPHLFHCTAHPNDLSTVNLWDRPVESIRELSFLDPGNLD